MWANWEIVALAEWLRAYNQDRAEEEKVGFYGLDVYSLWESLAAIIEYLERTDPDAAITAREAYRCFEPYGENVQAYARSTLFLGASCEPKIVNLLTELRRKAPIYEEDGREAFFNAEQNALVLGGAERYYRTMVRADDSSWNVRDGHMALTLERLMRHHGPMAKGIVWEHNTHVGDARATDMASAGMVNVGQLVRERHERTDVVLVGYGSNGGSVIAGDFWDAPMRQMRVPVAQRGSWEDLLHRIDGANKLLVLQGDPEVLRERRGHRAIGVVYNPALEAGNYVPTHLTGRYDAFLYIDDTRALHPLHLAPHDQGEPPETYPWGV
jgi:erythromycin esterase-like protein